nr:RNA-directed DNA polymerase, eukaryota [Tanacetum cinerariifolium]
MENSNKSFVSVLKRGSHSHVTPKITKPALVLDETCIKEFNFGMSLMGREKDVSDIPKLPCIFSKEGFQNVKLSYLGGMQKVIIHGKVYWIRVKELDAWFPNFQEDDQDDLSSDRESQEGDVANKADNNESDVEQVSTCDYFVTLMGTWAPNSFKLLIISVYASQELNERRELWDYLHTFIDWWEGDTVIIVDKLIDQGKSNDEILIKRITLLNVLQELNNRNAMEISQKAKIRWSIEGDENSKYFHDQVQDLERTVTYEEVKRAVWDCGTNKSPGQMDFPLNFTISIGQQLMMTCFKLSEIFY